MRKLLHGLREKKHIAVLLDQNTPPRDTGIYVPFFGRPVAVSSVPAALAIRTGPSVVTTACVPDESGRYYGKVCEILHPNQAADNPVEELTSRMTHSLEKLILEQPGRWCWMYKRWKNVPPGADMGRFPNYAKPLRKTQCKGNVLLAPRDYDCNS